MSIKMKWTYSDSKRQLYGIERKYSAKKRLLIFPHSGSGPSYYLKWLDYLPTDIEFWIINYPGREGRYMDPFATSIVELSKEIYQSVSELSSLPLYIFGHSLGAVVGFEVARMHEINDGNDLTKLIISSRSPRKLNDELKDSLLLPDKLFACQVLSKYGGISPEVINNDDFLELFIPIIKSDFNLLLDYEVKLKPKINTDLHAYFGENDKSFLETEINEWRDYTNKELIINKFIGGHFYFQNNLKEIVNEVMHIS
jgi:surfactin synthase thioesterase subunit